MEILLKKLVLHNFKGAADLTIDFANRTTISGANATGKTRVFDAFTWLLFGKDSEDRKDFNIKTLTPEGETEHMAESSVIGILKVDGVKTTYERTLREKWVKKRGEEKQEYSGNETIYSINGVPLKMSEYQERIDSVINEEIFKLLTNPMYFNALPWTGRREILFRIAGQISDQEIADLYPQFAAFMEELNGKSLKDFRIEIAARLRKLKEELAQIPPRIDEVKMAIQPDPDYAQIQTDIDKYNARLFQIDGLIASVAEQYNQANRENQDKQNEIYKLEQKISMLEMQDQMESHKAVKEAEIYQTDLRNEIGAIRREIDMHTSSLQSAEQRITQLTKLNETLRHLWTENNAKTLVFNEKEFICPACGTDLSKTRPEEIEQKKQKMLADFNKNKLAQLDSINQNGQTNKKEIDRLEQEAFIIKNQIEQAEAKLKIKLAEVEAIVFPAPVEKPKNAQADALREEISKIRGTISALTRPDTSSLMTEKVDINNALDGLKRALNVKEQNETRHTRLTELLTKEKDLAHQIAEIEKLVFQAEEFMKAKVRITEERINGMFSIVRFKMFNRLINGAIEECCDTLINGVPYQDANAAARVQGGLDIIHTLSDFYKVQAPVFIDNRESVTEIPEMDCQIISLYVDPTAKVLRIKTTEPQLQTQN